MDQKHRPDEVVVVHCTVIAQCFSYGDSAVRDRNIVVCVGLLALPEVLMGLERSLKKENATF